MRKKPWEEQRVDWGSLAPRAGSYLNKFMTKQTYNHRSICNAQEWKTNNYIVELGD